MPELVADKIPEERSPDSGRLTYERKADSQRNLEIRQFAIIKNNMRFNSRQQGWKLEIWPKENVTEAQHHSELKQEGFRSTCQRVVNT